MSIADDLARLRAMTNIDAVLASRPEHMRPKERAEPVPRLPATPVHRGNRAAPRGTHAPAHSLRARILKAMGQSKERVRPSQLAPLLGVGTRSVASRMQQLAEDGLLHRPSQGWYELP